MITVLIIAAAIAENQPSRLDKNDVRGKALYEQYCAACHGERALGDGPLAKSISKVPPLAGRFQHDSYPEMIELIQGGRNQMPAYEQLIDRTDSKRILIYLRRLDPETGKNLRKRSKSSRKTKTEESSAASETNQTAVQTKDQNQPTAPENKSKSTSSRKP